jgi:hypothetical protein
MCSSSSGLALTFSSVNNYIIISSSLRIFFFKNEVNCMVRKSQLFMHRRNMSVVPMCILNERHTVMILAAEASGLCCYRAAQVQRQDSGTRHPRAWIRPPGQLPYFMGQDETVPPVHGRDRRELRPCFVNKSIFTRILQTVLQMASN